MRVEDVVCSWEKEYNLFENGSIRGFDYYAYMRRDFMNTALNAVSGSVVDPFETKDGKDTGVKLLLKLMKHSMKLPKKDKDVDVLFLCHPRRQKNGDVYESVFTDFLEKEFPDSITLERLFDNHSHFEPAMTQNMCYVDRVVLASYISRIIASRLKRKEYLEITNEIKAIMEGPIAELERRLSTEAGFEVSLKPRGYYDRAVSLFYFYNVRKKYYGRFLDKVCPKVLVEIISKSFDAMVINEICRERNIPIVEIQHCLLGVTAIYPEGINERQRQDYYLAFSDYWKEYQKYPIPKENVFATGYPFFERQVKKYKKPKEDLGGNGARKHVLFISGKDYGKELSHVACDLKKVAGDLVDITYKLHPDEFLTWKEMYPELLENEIAVIDSKDVSIYEFFNDADVQVGVFSTAIYEGIAFDLDTYILNIPFARDFIDFCKAGNGILIESGNQLFEYISGMKESEIKKSSEAGGLSDKFWKMNAEENIIKALHEIIEKQN